MTEKEMFNNLLNKDPNPGTKNRVIRIDNYYLVPGWVFNKKENVKITYKNIKSRGVKAYNLTGQIIYDILMLGLTDINQRPRCPVCNKPVSYDCFSQGYYSTCGSAECKSEYARQEVFNLWQNSDYRNTQSNSHKEWAAIESNKEKMRQSSKKLWENEEYRKQQIESHIRWASDEENKKLLVKKLFARDRGPVECNKSSDEMYYESLWERDFIKFCDETDKIISINRSDISIKYEAEDGFIRTYHPDFLVITSDGRKLLVEVKNDWRFNTDERTKLKIAAGYKYVISNDNIDDYIVLLGGDLYINNNYKYVNVKRLSEKLGII